MIFEIFFRTKKVLLAEEAYHRGPPVPLYFSLNNEMLTSSTTCPNTTLMLEEAGKANGIGCLYDIGARASSSAKIPPHIDKNLGFDLVARDISLKSERQGAAQAKKRKVQATITCKQIEQAAGKKAVLEFQLAQAKPKGPQGGRGA